MSFIKKFKSRITFCKLVASSLVLLTNLSGIKADTEWDAVRFQGLVFDADYNVNMGSGFFVNEDTIVTNAHVVANCANIAIRGAVKSQQAKLYTIDPSLDLALGA